MTGHSDDWVDDDQMPFARAMAQFDSLGPVPTRGPDERVPSPAAQGVALGGFFKLEIVGNVVRPGMIVSPR